MIVEYLKDFVDRNNTANQCGFCWSFTHARKDYANLEHLTDANKCCVHFILEEYKLNVINDSDGDVVSWNYKFTAFVGLNSDFDIQYDNEQKHELRSEGKYEMYVKKIEDCITANFQNDVCINPLTVMGNWSFDPKINKYDNNFDGGYLIGIIRFINPKNIQ